MTDFGRPIRLDALGVEPLHVEIAATPETCAALAARFGLVAVGRLAATVDLTRDGDIVAARGIVDAAVVQACVATGVDLPATLHAPLALRFVPESAAPAGDVELDEGQLDVMDYSGGAIDLAEAVAQTMVLALDPWPRAADADAALRAAGVLSEADMSPFSGLKALRDRLV